MVSFQCEQCGDTLTKKKLDAHLNRCWNTSFTCLDCMTQFYGHDYRSHTSCISEAQKYQGALFKGDKKAKGQQNKPAPAPSTGHTQKASKSAYVEDVPDSPNPNFTAESTTVTAVPPRAPSPPSVTDESAPINVFDFLEPESPGSSVSSASSYKSSKQEHDLPEQMLKPALTPAPRLAATTTNPLYTYGSAPIPTSTHRYDSDLDIAMSDAAPIPTQTPAPSTDHNNRAGEPQSASQSDKKRKRGSPDEPENALVRTSRTKQDARTLHSGLTGGLNKLLTDPSIAPQAQASPLSPKKRSKRSKDEDNAAPAVPATSTTTKKSRKDEAAATAAAAAEAEKRLIVKSRGDLTTRPEASNGKQFLRRSERNGKPGGLEVVHTHTQAHLTATTTNGHRQQQQQQQVVSTKKHVPQLRQRPEQSHSEFFLGLIDKGPESSKGQSVWGVMKMFHEGLLESGGENGGGGGGGGGSNAMEGEDRRLFRGLRMKRGKSGEIVLFSRPEAELDG